MSSGYKLRDLSVTNHLNEFNSDIWGGENMYNVFTKSPGTALDGTKYKEW